MKKIGGTTLRLSVSSIALMLSWAQAGHAQQAAGNDGASVLLPEIVVENETDGASQATVGYVARSTGTGAKTNTPIEEIPQSVSIVSRQEMDDQGAQTADEALRYSAGVFAQPYGPDSDTNWFFLRGFDATQTGVFMDGLQLYGFGFGAFYVDSFNLDRVDVLRGAASVLYGGSSPGGIVNYVTKKPTGERLRYTELGVNDAGTAYLGFDIGDRINQAFDYRVSGRIQGGDGYYDLQEGYRGSISPSVTWAPNDSTSLTLLANYTYLDEVHGAASFLPYYGTVKSANFGRIDPEANYTEPDLDAYQRQQFWIGYEFEHEFDNDWAVRQNVRYGYANIHEFNLYPFGYSGFSSTPVLPDPVFSRIVFEHDTQLNTFAVDNQLEGEIETGPVKHDLLFGVDYKYFNMDQVQASATGTTISVTDPAYGSAQPTPVPYIDQNIVQQQIGAYIQDQLRFGDGWIATLNGRYDYVFSDATGTPAYQGRDGALSGRAGLAYEFANGLTPYASAATFFNPLIGSSSAVPFFEPETGEQFEIGLKYRPKWFDGLFTVSLFDLTRRNVVTGPFGAETQIGAVNSRGVEFEAKANITDDLKVTAAVTAYDLEITEDADTSIVGNTPNVVPEQLATLFVEYTHPEGPLEGVTVGGGIRYQGESWADNANTLKVPSATLFDAKVGYERDNWGIDLNVINIADTRYVASCDGVYTCSYGEGRSFRLKAYAKW
ncbi:TonB-dependent siderophore receptor [Roseibium aggregatum]|uniref:TonB-dependent siderophore receptor n=1 Tax=Roseibium aggregatum TaxID=187304 RepID=A0A939EIE7_9HYPH|nr:TonB-dependent siderophore receptor [Roseibium aggregatum]MBN9672295.1 TonB-dependent siderophore receptor [Roseibium aggregatum]